MSYEHELKRLRDINWASTGSNQSESHPALVKEFLTRSATLLTKMGVSGEDPFLSLSKLVGGQSLIDDAIRLSNRQVASSSAFPLVQWVSGWYLDGCLIADLMNDSESPFAKLYEPLIALFSDGGSIDKHHGEIIIDDKFALSLKDWRVRFSAGAK